MSLDNTCTNSYLTQCIWMSHIFMAIIWYVKRQVTLWSKYLILIIWLRYWHQFHTIVISKHCNKSVICIIVFHKTRKHFMSIHVPDISLSRTCPPYTIDGSVYSWFICKTVFLHWCPFMYLKCNVHVNAYNMRPCDEYVLSMLSDNPQQEPQVQPSHCYHYKIPSIMPF